MKRRVDGIDLWVENSGSGTPALLLPHGLGCTGRVWDGLAPILRDRWPGSWIIPDLRGHGRSDHTGRLGDYGIAMHAADLAALVRDAGPVIACGHSMGGLAALLLATGWYGVEVTAAVAVGVKVGFTDEEIAGARKLAETPTRWFETREDAIERFLKVSGLIGLVDPDSDVAASGVMEEGGRFRLAADIRTALVAGPSIRDIYPVARRQCPVVLACGEGDRMATIAATREMDADAVELKGLGHNAHVEDPEAIWNLIAGVARL